MKKLFLAILLISICYTMTYAQNDNPYSVFGYKGKVLKTNEEENGRQFLFINNSDTTQKLKCIAFNTKSHQIEYIDHNNNVYKTDSLLPIFVLRFLNPDPHSSKYPDLNPYCFVKNNPINAYDPDGRDVVFLIDKEGAGGRGHMSMLFQDKAGKWYYFTQGATGNGSQSGYASGSNYPGGVSIMPMQTVTKSGEIINMTKEQAIAFVQSGQNGTKYDNNITLKTTNKQDEIITQNAFSLQTDFQSQKEKYNVYTNNCAEATKDVVEGNKDKETGIELPPVYDPRPNSYFKRLQARIPFINGDVKGVTIPSTMDNIPSKQIVVPKNLLPATGQ